MPTSVIMVQAPFVAAVCRKARVPRNVRGRIASGGVASGPKKPNQEPASKPGQPLSATVGTAGVASEVHSTNWLTNIAVRTKFNYMVESEDDHLDAVFHALADRTRRTMLQLLAHGDSSVGELGAPFRMSFAGASKHVKALEKAGLVSRRVHGRTHVCRLEPAALAQADDWLRACEAFWNDRLDALEDELRRDLQSSDDEPGETR
jgi:DNA-binding transcriptional ArsR family regulator